MIFFHFIMELIIVYYGLVVHIINAIVDTRA